MKYIVACTLLLFLCGCPDDSIIPSTNPLQLTVADATCTEIFIRLSLPAGEQGRTVTLNRDDSTIATIIMRNTDSLFVDEVLLPKKSYTYTLVANDWSVSVQATTMDTTSHNWSFTLDTLGEIGSYLVDVAIINDTLAYAVGEIRTKNTYTYDSLGNWIDPYNVAKWNGRKWELLRLKHNCRLYYPNCGDGNGGGNILYVSANSVFAFSPNDIWIAAGGVHHFNGIEWKEEAGILGAGTASKIFGNLSEGLWFVGGNGFVAHRNLNGVWQKQESGTTHYLVDAKGNGEKLYIGGINTSRDAGIVLRKNHDTWEKSIEGVNEESGFIPQKMFKTQLYGSINGLWIDNNGTLYTVGNYMYRYKLGQWNYMKSLPENQIGGKLGYRGYLHDVNGTGSNDMFIIGQRGTLMHFNGITWTQVGIPFDYNDELHFWYRISTKDNLAIIVGSMDRHARIMVLKR